MDEEYKPSGEKPTLKILNLFNVDDGFQILTLENGPISKEFNFGKTEQNKENNQNESAKEKMIFHEKFHESYDFTIGYQAESYLRGKGFWYIKNNADSDGRINILLSFQRRQEFYRKPD